LSSFFFAGGQVYQTSSGRLAYSLKESALDELPITALRFRPASASSKTKNVLLAVGADGLCRHWHITSQRCMHTITEPGNQLYCVDYRKDGTVFATAGKDRTVRVYDEATKAIITEMSSG
jgi:COMPASS component SWD3